MVTVPAASSVQVPAPLSSWPLLTAVLARAGFTELVAGFDTLVLVAESLELVSAAELLASVVAAAAPASKALLKSFVAPNCLADDSFASVGAVALALPTAGTANNVLITNNVLSIFLRFIITQAPLS